MHPSVSCGIKDLATTHFAQPACCLPLWPVECSEVQLDPSHQGELVCQGPALCVQGFTAHMHGEEGRGVLCIYSDAGALHAQAEAKPVGGDRSRAARGAERALRRRVSRALHVAEVRAASSVPQVHAAERVHDLALRVARREQGLVAHFQDHSLLGVHDLGLGWRDAKHLVVEEIHALDVRHVPGKGLVEAPAVIIEVENLLMVPPHQRNLLQSIQARGGATPKGLRAPAGSNAARHTSCGHVLPLDALAVHGKTQMPRQLSPAVVCFRCLEGVQALVKPHLKLRCAGVRGEPGVGATRGLEVATQEERPGPAEVPHADLVRSDKEDRARGRRHL
mmetsp:Transcript_66879/g.157612  ORF Transcript_66879/g.157612 Transcript_66879/m.157612 type:complete len:335 (-) Transcript_66879:590-1594(-)